MIATNSNEGNAKGLIRIRQWNKRQKNQNGWIVVRLQVTVKEGK
jgi:hypothetical protein